MKCVETAAAADVGLDLFGLGHLKSNDLCLSGFSK